MPCPAERNFERVNDNGQYKCVYKSDRSQFVNLSTIGTLEFSGSTLEELQATNPNAATQFSNEKSRVTSELTSKYRSIYESRRIDDAFKALQDAQNAQDEAPEAYQAARTNYYTLLYGEGWKETEAARVAKTEVDPLVQQYKTNYRDLKSRIDSQKTTIDVVNNLKDNVLTLKDDFQYSVNTFSEQLEKLRNQINLDRRDRVKLKEDDPWKWIETVLNILIVIGLLAAIGIGYSRWSTYQQRTKGQPFVYTSRPTI